MYFITLIFRASFPLVAIIYFWISGTSPSEYDANFQTITGEVQGPYIMIYEKYDVVTVDSLENSPYLMSKYESLLMEHELYNSYTYLKNTMREESYKIDSLVEVPSAAHWETITSKNEEVVYSIDTVLYSEVRYPIEVPIKLSLRKSIIAKAYFSLVGHPGKIQIVFPEEREERELMEYPPLMIFLMAKAGVSFSKLDDLNGYFSQLKVFLNDHEVLSVRSLKSDSLDARAYKIWDENKNLVFEDEAGLEGLEQNESYVLWYDHWVVKMVIAIQALIYIVVSFDQRNNVKKSKQNSKP